MDYFYVLNTIDNIFFENISKNKGSSNIYKDKILQK